MTQEKPVLSTRGRQILARIRDMEQEGYSGRAMLRSFRGQLTENDLQKHPMAIDLHIKVSNTEFWKARRLAASWRNNAYKAKYGRNDRTIPEKSYAPTPFNLTRGRYQHVVKIVGRTHDGERLEKFVTVSSQKRLSKQEIYEDADLILQNDRERYEFNMEYGITFHLEEIYQTIS